MSTGLPATGRVHAARAETMNRTDPSRFTATIHRPRLIEALSVASPEPNWTTPAPAVKRTPPMTKAVAATVSSLRRRRTATSSARAW
ncbi:hypothetical protein [Streptomyces sp. NPDC017868]|uniref:hypothetical protein n=1 Tax=unclassified Streptomyces TaxID=2593676 RepID=UPI0037A73F94